MTLPNLPHIRIAAGSLFFKLVQETNDASKAYYDRLYVNYWFHYATRSWCEELFTEQSNYVPADFKGNELAPFDGICLSLNNFGFAEDHGYGMSAVIKYLVDQYGNSVLTKVYDRLREKENCITAIINSVKDSTKTWWPDFFKEYVGGRIYGVKGNLFAESKLGEFNINSKSDTLKIFTGSYRDLSAKIYRINLNYPDIDSSAQIRFQLNTGISSEYVTVMVFGLKGDSLEYFDQGDDLTVKNAKDLTSQGYDLVAVVVNSLYEAPYNEKSNIDLEIKVVTKPEPQLTHNRFSLGVEVMGHWLRDDGSEYDYRVDPLYCFWGYGSFSGYTFQDSWDRSFDVGHSRGHMTATVDPTLSQVTSFNAIDTTWFTADYYDTIIVSISGSGLPIYSTYGGDLEFRVYGTQACNYISSFSYRDQIGNDWVEVKNFWCDSESDLVIYFYKE
jgi:hypothetical protein